MYLRLLTYILLMARTLIWATIILDAPMPRLRHTPGQSPMASLASLQPWDQCQSSDVPQGVLPKWYVLSGVLGISGRASSRLDAVLPPLLQVAQQLNTLLSEHLQGNTQFFSGASQASGGTGGGTASFYRPLLIIFDRNDDLITALHHTSTYQVGLVLSG